MPVQRFDHLYQVARNFAQLAVQSAREYVAFQKRTEDETFNQRQLEQTVQIAEAVQQVEATTAAAARTEVRAARSASSSARRRIEIANQALREYRNTGWEIARLEEAAAWSGAASVGEGDEVRQSYSGLEHLGISADYIPRSDLTQKLAWARAQRSYDLRLADYSRAVSLRQLELDEAEKRETVTEAMAEAAVLREQSARWRAHFARSNVEFVRQQSISPRLYFEMAKEAKRSAEIYLDRAIETAFLMERAYKFELVMMLVRSGSTTASQLLRRT